MTTVHPTSTRDSAGLRGGLTTGTCAAAASKAAALALFGDVCESVEIALPDGDVVTVPIASVDVFGAHSARAAVIKDSGDDPDVTNGMTVEVALELGGEGTRFAAGEGVGTVMRPGLLLEPGEPAINPVPRRMIAEALEEVFGNPVGPAGSAPIPGALVTVSIPGGAKVAEGTFNPRLGIEGGLSVIGTSGRVVPKSSEAWMRSLLPQVDVALAAGHREIWLTTGGRGDAFAMGTLGAPVAAVVQASNFIGALLDKCADAGVERVVLVGHAGKLLKVAAGIFDTHSRTGDARMEALAAIAAAEGAPNPLAARLLETPTVEAAVGELEAAGLADVWDAVASRVAARSTQRCGLPVEVALIGYHDELLGATDGVPGFARVGRGDPVDEPRIQIVGVGPGAEDTLTPVAWRAIRRARVVVGGRRQLAAFAPDAPHCIELGADVQAALRTLGESLEADPTARAVVLASGDPGFFGVLDAVRRVLPEVAVSVQPGISSIQTAAARLGRSWSAATLASAHGRDVAAVVEACERADTVFALCDRTASPERLASLLAERDPAGFDVCVVERAGLPDQRVTCGSAEQIAEGAFDALSVVVIDRKGGSR